MSEPTIIERLEKLRDELVDNLEFVGSEYIGSPLLVLPIHIIRLDGIIKDLKLDKKLSKFRYSSKEFIGSHQRPKSKT